MRRLTAGFALALLCIVLGAIAAIGAEYPKATLYAEGGAWHTVVSVKAPLTSSVIWPITRCNIGFAGGTLSIPANGAALVRNIGGLQCERADFGVVPGPITGESNSFLEFNDGKSRTDFFVPQLPPFAGAAAVFRSRAIVNNAELATFIAAYNDGPKTATLRVLVFDGSGKQIATETVFAIRSKSLGFQQLATRLDAGSVQIEIGCTGFSVPGACDTDAGPIYGFVSVGPLSGASVDVQPIADNR